MEKKELFEYVKMCRVCKNCRECIFSIQVANDCLCAVRAVQFDPVDSKAFKKGIALLGWSIENGTIKK